jgi:hypothetical protein
VSLLAAFAIIIGSGCVAGAVGWLADRHVDRLQKEILAESRHGDP